MGTERFYKKSYLIARDKPQTDSDILERLQRRWKELTATSMDQYLQIYPATYHAPIKGRVRSVFVYTLLFMLSMFGRAHISSKTSVWQWFFAISFLIFVIIINISISFCTVTLYPDRIERKTWFGRKIMKKSDAGQIRKRGHGLVMLTYKYNGGDGIVFPKGIGGDAAWNAWMTSVDAGSALGQDRPGAV